MGSWFLPVFDSAVRTGTYVALVGPYVASTRVPSRDGSSERIAKAARFLRACYRIRSRDDLELHVSHD